MADEMIELAEQGIVSEDISAALERMERMTAEELDAFRSADTGYEFGAAHLDRIREVLRRRDEAQEQGELTTSPSRLMSEILRMERGDSEGEDAEAFLRYLQANRRGGAPATVHEGTLTVYQVSKVMLVGAVIDVVQNGRKVNELSVTHPEGQAIALYAHPTADEPWGGALEDWLDAQLMKVSEEAARRDAAS